MSDEEMEVLINNHRKAVYGLACKLMRKHEDAEDVTSETMLRACYGRIALDPSRNPRAWLLRVARNLCIDLLTRDRLRNMPPVDDNIEQLSDGQQSAEQRLLNRDSLEAVLQHASQEERAVLSLYSEGHSPATISRVLDFSPDRVKVVLYRAFRHIRKSLKRRNDGK